MLLSMLIDPSDPGHIRSVYFFDNVTVDHCTNALVSGMLGGHWLVILCENCILFYDYRTQEVLRITKQDLDIRLPNPLCVCVVSASLIAIGCSDNEIRIWDMDGWRIAKSLNPGHTKVV